jgi:hypothetical protein
MHGEVRLEISGDIIRRDIKMVKGGMQGEKRFLICQEK